jgi:hypothetical protein
MTAIEDCRTAPIGPVDVLIINVVLPVLDLAEALARLRELPGLAQARCAVTVLDDLDNAHIPAGCDTLTKPVTAEALRRFLRL